MPFATARTITLQGAVGHLVDVQVDVSAGLVGTTLVGRPDAAINEGRDRCRMAIQNSGLTWPATRRVTILLSPADVPKSGPHFDLAMALAIVAAADGERLGRSVLDGTVFIGELTLDGRLRPVPGVLPMTMAAARRGVRRVFVPESQTREAAMVPGMEVVGLRSLGQAVAHLSGAPWPEAPPVDPVSGSRLLAWRGETRVDEVDLSDVQGMDDARYALEVAAAGGHHLMLSGPKGSGKTTLAERIPGIMPDLDTEEALELAAIHSLAGILQPGADLAVRPPFSAPHSSSTRASVLGGGAGKVRPGEVSRAHCGVLFLDEFPLFSSDIIEALRQPLESGEVTIGRGEESATYPARGMFVFACNPCPCGNYRASVHLSTCDCPEVQRRTYRRRVAGPMADRIDITRHVEPLDPSEGLDPLAVPESSAVVRARVEQARERQRARYRGLHWRTNAQAPGPVLSERWPLQPPAARQLDRELQLGRVTRRGATRVHRLAWTVADLHGVEVPALEELDVALRLRMGEPLLLTTLTRRRAG
ncbi:Magnesium-chelatase (Mg-protoporphyrin IX chelatase) [metagenome]|uniref:Magnesium-chelatase (Mg-protoporphyrin IX chelatase) n=1 Tax=metagenome TaxID=256318 RepID=A0A2P2CCU0_9ZZZZ